MSEKKGITLVGNILCDVVKTIDSYPEMGMLSNIKKVSLAVGGCVSNTGIDLAKIDKDLKLTAIGRVGNDEYGRYVVGQLNNYRLDTSYITVSDSELTSFSDVMSLASGERTFFHSRGANAEFSPEHIDIEKLDCEILHAGYILLLDKFDEFDREYGTAMARFLKSVQERGIKTSADAVSDARGLFREKIMPALKYLNYIVFNEIECCNIWGISPYFDDGKLNVSAIETAMRKTMEYGVKDKVIVHCKKAGFCLNKEGEFTVVPSLNIPKSMIKGSVGAGDAFSAGSLYGIYKGFSDKDILTFGAAAAASNLTSENSVDGMKTRAEIEEMAKIYGSDTLNL